MNPKTITGQRDSFAATLIFLVGLLLAVLLTSCTADQSRSTTETAAAMSTATLEATLPVSTATTRPMPSNTPKPTLTFTTSPTDTSAPTPTEENTPTASPSPPTDITLQDFNFSMLLPEGFELVTGPDGPVVIGPTYGEEGLASITFSLDPDKLAQDEFGMFMYTAMAQDQLIQDVSDLVQLGEEFPTEDQPYFRWTIEFERDGENYHQVVYFFDVGDAFLVVIYSRPIAVGEENDEPVEQAIKTLTFEP